MATIKAIEARSVHQIQSGQVIVDICSVVKELVENSIDAGATSIEVRFKNHGLDAIEVQDNGEGIAPDDFETVALKHFTSKLSTYSDLDGLKTFGFRGEALSSLCALSQFHIITARACDQPKGTKLDFEVSGKIKGTSVVASQKGTTIVIENLFKNLPVRRRELEKNIKREYGKVLGLLHAYACISTGIRFSVSNQMPKGKKAIVFSTKTNATTKENISNVYGAKTLLALLPLELKLEMQTSNGLGRSIRNVGEQESSESKQIHIQGHISRPVVGEGRQTPDRQMFFVNSRPCMLPQVAKVFNEVYKSYNITQSPFIFANIRMDTNAYDVNVSPDKRTILLHDQTVLLEKIRSSLVELFEAHEQSVPQAQLPSRNIFAHQSSAAKTESLLLSNKPTMEETPHELSTEKNRSLYSASASSGKSTRSTDDSLRLDRSVKYLEPDIELGATLQSERAASSQFLSPNKKHMPLSESSKGEIERLNSPKIKRQPLDGTYSLSTQLTEQSSREDLPPLSSSVLNDNTTNEENIPSLALPVNQPEKGSVQNAFDRIRPKRMPEEAATITIGSTTTVSTIGTPRKRRCVDILQPSPKRNSKGQNSVFNKTLRSFSAANNGPDATDVENESSSEEHSAEGEGSGSGEESGSEDNVDTSPDSQHDQSLSPRQSQSDRSLENHNPDQDKANSESSDDEEYIDESLKKVREEAKVAHLIQQAELAASRPTDDNMKRATSVLKGPWKKNGTLQMACPVTSSVKDIEYMFSLMIRLSKFHTDRHYKETSALPDLNQAADIAEERLSLTVSKSDFERMHIIGQFNLGFILAVRSANTFDETDELFIIDQHASDEKYNFERLQNSTILTPQPLVHPHPLNLTAIEEEIILSHTPALTANGFQVSFDTSGKSVVGSRSSLLTLPTSREVTFTPSDFEELLVLLGERSGAEIPRPGKVRKLLAMRACRSSVMIGKTLTTKQMERVVKNMGTMEKPWNCPHGRPTMRHLFGLGSWKGWQEGDGVTGLGETPVETDWKEWIGSGK